MSFKPGDTVEAKNSYDKWCEAQVLHLDYDDSEALIRFKATTSSYDEWMPFSKIRKFTGVTPSKEDLQRKFKVGEKVMAKWKSEVGTYPAEILSYDISSDSYEIRFYDGFIRKYKSTRIQKMTKADKEKLALDPPPPPVLVPVNRSMFDTSGIGTKEDRRARKRKIDVVSLFRPSVRSSMEDNMSERTESPSSQISSTPVRTRNRNRADSVQSPAPPVAPPTPRRHSIVPIPVPIRTTTPSVSKDHAHKSPDSSIELEKSSRHERSKKFSVAELFQTHKKSPAKSEPPDRQTYGKASHGSDGFRKQKLSSTAAMGGAKPIEVRIVKGETRALQSVVGGAGRTPIKKCEEKAGPKAEPACVDVCLLDEGAEFEGFGSPVKHEADSRVSSRHSGGKPASMILRCPPGNFKSSTSEVARTSLENNGLSIIPIESLATEAKQEQQRLLQIESGSESECSDVIILSDDEDYEDMEVITNGNTVSSVGSRSATSEEVSPLPSPNASRATPPVHQLTTNGSGVVNPTQSVLRVAAGRTVCHPTQEWTVCYPTREWAVCDPKEKSTEPRMRKEVAKVKEELTEFKENTTDSGKIDEQNRLNPNILEDSAARAQHSDAVHNTSSCQDERTTGKLETPLSGPSQTGRISDIPQNGVPVDGSRRNLKSQIIGKVNGQNGFHGERIQEIEVNAGSAPKKTRVPDEIFLQDPTLPEGWMKRASKASGATGKRWAVVLMGPCGTKFYSRKGIAAYLEASGLKYDLSRFNFSLGTEFLREFGAGAALGTKEKKKREPGVAMVSKPVSMASEFLPTPNDFMCPGRMCNKSFRSAVLLHMHIKHQHPDLSPADISLPKVSDLAYARVQNGADEDSKQRGEMLSPSSFSCQFQSFLTRREENLMREVSAGTENGESEGSNGMVVEAVEENEDLVHCTCGYNEEDGLMIQCDICMCWQHGVCFGILTEEEVSDRFTCSFCITPKKVRASMRVAYDENWLKDGKMARFSFVDKKNEHANPKRVSTLRRSHAATAEALEIGNFLHKLTKKIEIAKNKEHPKLYLWARPEEQEINQDGKKGESPEVPLVSEEIPVMASQEAADFLMEELPEDAFDASFLESSDIAALLPTSSELEQMSDELSQKGSTRPSGVPQAEIRINNEDCHRNLVAHIRESHSVIERRLEMLEKVADILEKDNPPTPNVAKLIATLMKDVTELSVLSSFS